MNVNIENIIKKYLRKVILPYHGFDYDEVSFTMQPINFETIPQKYRLFFDFKINPYKVLSNGYHDYRLRSQFEMKIDNDLRTLGTAFNVQCGWDFENDVELTDKFAIQYIPILRNKIKKNGLEKDLDIAFGWNDEESRFEFFINDYDLEIEDKVIILETFGKMFGNTGIKIDFGNY
jgi:hypothetical protein